MGNYETISKDFHPKPNKDNIETLSRIVIEEWDQKTLLQFAMDHLILVHEEDKECFRRDWDANMK